MPKRTAAEFAREAPQDGPYELEVGSGKTKRFVTPKPYSDITGPQRVELARINNVWATMGGQWPTVDGVAEMTPDVFILRVRFDALEQREPTKDDPRAFVPRPNADFDAFHDEWYSRLPIAQWSGAMDELDAYYDPTPGTVTERAAAAAGGVLEQCRALLAGSDVDTPQVKTWLADIAAVAEKASAAAGKSTAGAG